MKIFDRYMAGRFVKPFLFGMALFALLVFLVDVFDKMPRLVKSQASLWVILQYLWLEVPYWSVRAIPLATLLAALFGVSGFVRSGEWIAVQSAGFDARAFFRPMLAMAALVTVLSFAAQETVLPACYRRAQKLWRDQIHPEWEWDIFQDVLLTARAGVYITTQLFTVKDGRLARPVVDYYGEDGIVRQITAGSARWDPKLGRWVFGRGADRRFEPGGAVRETSFESLVSDLDASPRALVPKTKGPDEMSVLETWRHLKEVRSLGGSSREAWSAFHSKLAYPFANLVLAGLGIPIALRLKARSRAVAFSVAIGVCFLFLWVLEMGRAMAVAGRLHPAPAAWLANAAFGSLALFLYRRMRA